MHDFHLQDLLSTCVVAGSLGEVLLVNYQETQVVVPDSDAGQEIQAGTVAVVLL